jgi:hypothetical protein
MQSELEELQRWYLSKCNGDWEHTYGVKIGTLDNPGWHVEIDLAETSLEERNFSPISHLSPDADWIDCKVVDRQFRGAGGPAMLGRILRTFLDWSREAPVQSNAHAG